MNPRNTALLFLVAAALGAFVYLYEIRGGEQRKEQASAAKRLYPGVDAAAVEWIALTSSDGKAVEAERSEGRWKITKPLVALGDPVALDGMASALAEVQSEVAIDAPQAPEVYGLGDGAKIVRFRAAGGGEQTLRIGKRTPVGPNTYAGTADTTKVFAIPTYRASSFDRAFDDLRERRILRFDMSAIEAADVWFGAEHVSAARKDHVWSLVAPAAGPGDETALEKLLSDMSFLRASGFLDDATPDTDVGLASPEVVVELRGKPPTEGAPPPVFRLAMGPPLPGDEKHRAARAGDGTLYLVPVERILDVPRSVNAYRFKDVAKFVASDAQRLELTFHDASEAQPVVASIQRSDTAGWQIEGGELISGKPTRLVAELSRLRAQDIVTDAPSAAEEASLGLAPPGAIVRVYGAKTAQAEPLLAEVQLGRVDAQGVVARAGSGGAIYRLEPSLAEHLPTSLAVWRDAFLSKPASPSAPTPPVPDADATAPLGTPPADGNADPKAEDAFPPTTELQSERPH
jgi:hypothetical protein